MTTPQQQPVLHFWRTHPDPGSLSVDQIVHQSIAVGEMMQPALDAVIANHLETGTPVVLEGDFILPALAARSAFGDEANNGRVRGVFLYEPDEAQLVANFLQREPQHGPQHTRARVSWFYGQWLKQQAEQHGVIALPARPWNSVFDRIVAALG